MSTAGPAALSWNQSCCILSHTAAVVAAGTGSLELQAPCQASSTSVEDIFVPSSPGTCTATGKAGFFSRWKKTPCALENSRCLVFIRKFFCRERRVAVNSTVPHLGSHVSPCHAAVCQGEPANSWLLNESPIYLEVVPGTPAG